MLQALKRPSATTVALIGAFLLILSFAPPAHAQVDVGNISDTAKDAVDTVDDVSDTVEDTTDQLRQPPSDDGPIKDTVNKVTDTVDEATGGASQPVTDEVRKISNENLAPVDDLVGETLGNSSDGPAPALRANDPGTDTSFKQQQNLSSDNTDQVQGERFGAGSTDAESAPSTDVVDQTRLQAPSSPRGSIADQIGRIATEIAFPLALVVMVAAFLLIQSRLDKKDPKLALAPLDIDEQYLSFR